MPHGDLTADELAGLSVEERAGLEEVESDIEALRRIVGDDAGARADAGKPDDAGDGRFTPAYIAKVPDDYEQQLAALEQRREDAIAKLKAGDIELDAMLAEQHAVAEERRRLDEQRLKAEISAEQVEQAGTQRWMLEVRRFMRGVEKHEGIDYRNNPLLNAALDAEVKALANDEANADKSGEWFLAEAHKRVKQALAEARGGAGEGNYVDGAHADQGTRDDSVFEALEGLDGMELERAVARMTPEQQERWARS